MKRKRTHIKIETRRSITYTLESSTGLILCAACGRTTKLLSISEAAPASGRSESAPINVVSNDTPNAYLSHAGDPSSFTHSESAMSE